MDMYKGFVYVWIHLLLPLFHILKSNFSLSRLFKLTDATFHSIWLRLGGYTLHSLFYVGGLERAIRIVAICDDVTR